MIITDLIKALKKLIEISKENSNNIIIPFLLDIN
jgi:hypothetical protein